MEITSFNIPVITEWENNCKKENIDCLLLTMKKRITENHLYKSPHQIVLSVNLIHLKRKTKDKLN